MHGVWASCTLRYTSWFMVYVFRKMYVIWFILHDCRRQLSIADFLRGIICSMFEFRNSNFNLDTVYIAPTISYLILRTLYALRYTLDELCSNLLACFILCTLYCVPYTKSYVASCASYSICHTICYTLDVARITKYALRSLRCLVPGAELWVPIAQYISEYGAQSAKYDGLTMECQVRSTQYAVLNHSHVVLCAQPLFVSSCPVLVSKCYRYFGVCTAYWVLPIEYFVVLQYLGRRTLCTQCFTCCTHFLVPSTAHIPPCMQDLVRHLSNGLLVCST